MELRIQNNCIKKHNLFVFGKNGNILARLLAPYWQFNFSWGSRVQVGISQRPKVVGSRSEQALRCFTVEVHRGLP